MPLDARPSTKVEWPILPTMMIGPEVLFVILVATVPLTCMFSQLETNQY